MSEPNPAAAAARIDPAVEVARLARAARLREDFLKDARARRRRELRAIAALLAAVLVPAAALAMFASPIAERIPAMARLYSAIGIPVNVRGLAIRDVEPQLLETDGTRIFALRGTVENVSGAEKRIPPIRFALHAQGREVFSWSLPASTRALKPGESTGFLTRISAPPEAAENVEIRFAREGEISSNAAP